MWTNAYVTKNLQYFDNPYTPGQCGGMCAVWLANMHNRRNLRSLVATKPHSMAAIDTHLAGLRLAAPGSKVSVGVPTPPPAPPKEFRLKRKDLTKLPVEAANMRYVAAAGLKPGPLKKAL